MMAMTTSNSIRVNAVFFPDYFPFIFISVPELNPDSNQNPEPFGSSSPLNLMVGRSAGARTPDQWLKRPLLYQLSYTPSNGARSLLTVPAQASQFMTAVI